MTAARPAHRLADRLAGVGRAAAFAALLLAACLNGAAFVGGFDLPAPAAAEDLPEPGAY